MRLALLVVLAFGAAGASVPKALAQSAKLDEVGKSPVAAGKLELH